MINETVFSGEITEVYSSNYQRHVSELYFHWNY